MRDLLISIFVLGALPVCYRKPFVGLLLFSVLAYMRLQDLAWGFARYERWSFYVAIVTVSGYIMAREKAMPVFEVRTSLMLVLAAFVGLGQFFARGDAPVNPTAYIEFLKIIFIAIFTTAVVRNRHHLRALLWVIAMSFAFYGAKNGIAGIIRLGRLQILRGPGGMLEDNNDFALAMAMAIPLLLHLGLAERRPLLRKGALVLAPLTFITVILTHSRGGALAAATGIMMLVWRSRNRFMGILIGFFIVLSALVLAPAEYRERLATIKDFRTEGSAQGRLRAWAVGARMVKDNPLWGVGFDRFQDNFLDYEPDPTPEQVGGTGTLVAHNSYVQIWAECGTPAFAIYIGLILLSFVDVWRVRKQARRRYYASWILNYCTMFEAALATFVIGSVFLNRAHFDLIYHYVAIVLVFGRVAREEMAKDDRRPHRSSGSRRGGPLVPVQRNGFGWRPKSGAGFRKTVLVPGEA